MGIEEPAPARSKSKGYTEVPLCARKPLSAKPREEESK